VRHVVKRPELVPFSEPVFLILSSVAAGPRHGYAILQDVTMLSDGRVRLSTGTLYGALRRLLDDGWIRRFKEADPSRDRQAYELTSTGRHALAAEVDRMKHLAKVAAGRLAEA
jgi:DNA-binding PadR family transcriptional regulator